MSVLVSRRAKGSPALSSAAVKRLGQQMLAHLGLEASELSILLTNDAFIHELNLEHRGKDKPTDVLSFPQNEFKSPLVLRPGGDLSVLGDVIVSLDTAQRQADSRRRPLAVEVRFLLAHGLLHLLGYDHLEPEEKKLMTRETKKLVLAAPLPTES